MPAASARSIASFRPCEKPPPPQELLVATTGTGFAARVFSVVK